MPMVQPQPGRDFHRQAHDCLFPHGGSAGGLHYQFSNSLFHWLCGGGSHFACLASYLGIERFNKLPATQLIARRSPVHSFWCIYSVVESDWRREACSACTIEQDVRKGVGVPIDKVRGCHLVLTSAS